MQNLEIFPASHQRQMKLMHTVLLREDFLIVWAYATKNDITKKK